jgi:hypothetical protein
MELELAEVIILKNLESNGGTGNVMEFLSYDVSEFDDAFAIANSMQNKDLVKLLYSNFNKNQIVVEITLLGVKLANEPNSFIS